LLRGQLWYAIRLLHGASPSPRERTNLKSNAVV
jgi:hypothetical protein